MSLGDCVINELFLRELRIYKYIRKIETISRSVRGKLNLGSQVNRRLKGIE